MRPVFLALLLAWLWRIVLLSLWMGRVGRIDLALVPTHPDRAGGVALVERLPGAFALVSLALSAMLAFSPALGRTRKKAIRAYSALVGRQGALVHQRWIEGREVAAEPISQAPEIGPVADAASMYEAVVKMRRLPVGKVSLIGILLPLALPLLVVTALQLPLKDLLLELAKALVQRLPRCLSTRSRR